MNAPIFFSLLLAAASAQTAFAACTPGDFVRHHGTQISINIVGRGYSPACLIVRAGTTITIDASRGHPLQGAQAAGSPPNPFLRGSEATSPETHELSEPGRYDYFCTRHGDANGTGMAGTILVE